MTDYNKLKSFYLGKSNTPELLTIDRILSFNRMQFELHHHFIQWLFPIDTISFYNLYCPRLTKEEIGQFGAEPGIRERVLDALRFVCIMYELNIIEHNGQILIEAASNFTGWWLTKNNHNHLRITRIAKSLTYMGLHDYARAFITCAIELGEYNPGCVTEKTLEYWKNAFEEIPQ